MADLVGNRNINLVGTLILGVFIAASAGARTGIQFIVFRAIQGVGAALCFPTAVSIITASFAQGRTRNIAFSFLGFGQPFGFQVGLVLSGVFANSSVTWRFAFYLCAGATLVLFGMSCWCLPQDRPRETVTWTILAFGIDWAGVLISSTSLGFISYVLA